MKSFITTFFLQACLPSPFQLFLVLVVLLLACYSSRMGKSLKKYRIVFAVYIVWGLVFSLPVTANYLVNTLESRYKVPQIATQPSASEESRIVILASGWSRTTERQLDSQFDRHTWQRLYSGVELWRKIGGKIYILGGKIDSVDIPIAEMMSEAAVAWGVPPNAIIVEVESRTTFQNLDNVAGALSLGEGRIYLVTSAIHMYRSMLVAKKLSLDFIPYPCDFINIERFQWSALLPTLKGQRLLHAAAHEWIGIIYYKLRNRI